MSELGETPVMEEPIVYQESRSRRNRLAALGVGILALAGVGGAIAISHTEVSASADGTPAVSAAEAHNNCDSLVSAEAASNSSNYNTEAYLPKTGNIKNQDDAQKYVTSLFGKNGPLAGKGDYASLAAIDAAVVKPAHDGDAVNPKFNYLDAFSRSLSGFRAAGGNVVAQKTCNTAYDTLVQVASYTDSWVQKGETVTELQAIRDKSNDIIGMKLVPTVTGTTYQGILLQFNNKTTKGLDGFTDVFIASNQGDLEGRMFVKGATTGQSGKQTPNTSEVTVPAQANQQNRNNRGQAGTNGGGQHNGNNQGVGNTGGAAGPNGNNPEAGPGGNTPSPGGPGETTPGTTPGGTTPGGTTPETTPGTTPGTTTPPETTPPTTTPPSTTPTTRPPSTTTLPPKSPPGTLPPPPGGY